MSKHHRASDKALRTLGSLIVLRRQERGLTSREMAEELGISQSCLSRIENGSREIRLEILHKLCQRLDLEGEVVKYLKTGKF